jgi:hypothetical protein
MGVHRGRDACFQEEALSLENETGVGPDALRRGDRGEMHLGADHRDASWPPWTPLISIGRVAQR